MKEKIFSEVRDCLRGCGLFQIHWGSIRKAKEKIMGEHEREARIIGNIKGVIRKSLPYYYLALFLAAVLIYVFCGFVFVGIFVFSGVIGERILNQSLARVTKNDFGLKQKLDDICVKYRQILKGQAKGIESLTEIEKGEEDGKLEDSLSIRPLRRKRPATR